MGMQKALESFDRIERIIKNALWREGGCELVEQVEREINTCHDCGHATAEFTLKCPICGADKSEDTTNV